MSTIRLAASMFAAAMALAVASLPAAGQVQFKRIVMSDQPVPGMPGVTFGDNFWDRANDNGDVLFQSHLTGPGVTTANDEAYWIANGNSIAKIVREGDQVPGLPAGFSFSFQNFPPIVRIADGGHIYLKNTIRGPNIGGSNDEYLFAGTAGSLQIIARETSSVEQQMPDSFESFQNNTGSISNSGKVLFSGTRRGEQNSSDWLSSGGSLTRVTPPDSAGTFNDSEDVLIGGYTKIRVKFAGSGSIQTIVTAGDAAPGTESGVQVARFEYPADFNNSGTVLFRPTLEGTGVTASNQTGYWIGRPGGEVVKFLRNGDPIPGLPGVFWSGGTPFPSISDTGHVLLQMTLIGDNIDTTNNGVLVTGAPGDIRIIAREGDQAPGLAPGVVHSFTGNPGISESGRVAFTSQLSGPGVTTLNQWALWQYSPDDDMVHLLLRSGDLFEVAPGDFRTLTGMSLGSLPWHMPDQVSFQASFTDGTRGIFVASVPEPAGLVLASAGLVMCVRRRQAGRRVLAKATARADAKA